MRSIVALIITCSICSSIIAQENKSWMTDRNDIPEKYKWDTKDLYESPSEWEKDYEMLQKQIPAYEKYRGQLGRSAEVLLSCLQFDDKTMMQMNYLRLYAKLHRDVDMNKQEHQDRWAKHNMLESKINAARSFISPEILKIDPDELQGFLKKEKDLKIYAHHFESLMQKKKHTLSQQKEQELTQYQLLLENSYSLYGSLVYSELPYPTMINDKNEEITLNRANSWNTRASYNRDIRKQGYENYYLAMGDYKQTLALNLNTFLAGKVYLAEARNYPSALDASLSRYHIPTEIYETLIQTMSINVQPLQRWMEIKKRMLNVDTLHLYDIRSTMFPATQKEYSWEEAELLVIESLGEMGPDYLKYIEDAYQNRWIDALPNSGKETGGYSTGPGGPHPYVKMNWSGSLFDFYTLVHELGHYVHGFKLIESQEFIYRDYPPFIGEIASTTAENISQLYLIEHAKNKNEKKYFIEQYIDNILLNIYFPAMMAEFELKMYQELEGGGHLNTEKLGELYGDILNNYFGAKIGITEVDKLTWLEWPHFYLDFYLFSYATSFVSSIQLASEIKQKGRPAIQNFMSILEAGTSEYPVDVLRNAGLDLNTPAPYIAVSEMLNKLMDELEELL